MVLEITIVIFRFHQRFQTELHFVVFGLKQRAIGQGKVAGFHWKQKKKLNANAIT